jgi:hypothetical protein
MQRIRLRFYLQQKWPLIKYENKQFSMNGRIGHLNGIASRRMVRPDQNA